MNPKTALDELCCRVLRHAGTWLEAKHKQVEYVDSPFENSMRVRPHEDIIALDPEEDVCWLVNVRVEDLTFVVTIFDVENRGAAQSYQYPASTESNEVAHNIVHRVQKRMIGAPIDRGNYDN